MKRKPTTEGAVVGPESGIGEAARLRWGVLGCGVIANEMAQALELEGRCIDAVANRTREVDAGALMEVTADVMRMMTGFRRDWGLLYPGELQPGRTEQA